LLQCYMSAPGTQEPRRHVRVYGES
jgi:hypothetical protein